MDEKQNQEAPKMSSVESEQEEFEMNHTDKIVGVFSEPGKTFAKMAKFPLKTADWIIPVCTLIIITILSIIVTTVRLRIKKNTVTYLNIIIYKDFSLLTI